MNFISLNVEWKHIFDSISDLAMVLNLDHSIIAVNQAVVKSTGLKHEELIGKKCFEVFHCSDHPPEFCPHESVLVSNKPKSTTCEMEALGGFHLVTVSPIFDDTGKLTHTVHVARDITEMKYGAKALQESESRLNLALKAANQGLYDLNLKTGEAIVNAEYASMLGYEPATFVETNQNWIKRLHPDDLERVSQYFSSYIKGEINEYKVEFRQKTKQGNWKWILSLGEIVEREEDGNPIRMLGTHTDITDLKKMEQSLKESGSLLKSIFRTSPVGIGLVIDRVFKWTNEKLSQLTGYSEQELTGENSRLVYPNDETYAFVGKEKYEQINKYGTGTVETQWQKKDGTIIDVLLSSTPLDLQDLSAGVTFTALDITKVKRYQADLKTAKDEWERSFNAIQDLVTIQDKDMRILRVNDATCQFFNKKQEEIIGGHCYELFRGVSEPCVACPLEATLQDADAHSTIIEHKNLGKTFQVSSSPILNKKGRIEQLIHVAKDVTRQQKMEEELLQAHKMEAIGTLAGGVAHDFNNILSAVIGYAELAKINMEDPPKAISDIDEILKAGYRAQNLVKQILTFSRKGEQKLESFKPYVIVKEALKLLRASIPSTIEIQEEIDANSGAVTADPTNIQQVLMNLCTNALHAMENEQGVLKVTLSQKELSEKDVDGELGVSAGPFVELKVSDTGCGMDKEVISRIFEPYFTTKDTGSGMGLSVVHGIIRSYGGMIKVESEVDKGTTFSVNIPAADKIIVKQKTRQVKALPTGNEHIMVVDDEDAIINFQKAALEHLGYTVTATTSSLHAFNKFEANPGKYDLIITDQTMPHMPGSELAKEVFKIRPGFPIILCTGYSSLVSEKAALKMGIKEFILKPVDWKKLAQIVRTVLDSQRKTAGE